MYRVMCKLCFLTGLVVFFCSSQVSLADAKTYYVALGGSDNNDGSISAPFKSIQKASDLVNPGDIVIVKDGVYTDTDNDNFIVNLNRGGTPDQWITFRSETKWAAVLDGQNNKTRYGWNFGNNANYVRIENFEMKGTLHAAIWNNSGAHHIYVFGCWIHHTGRGVEKPEEAAGCDGKCHYGRSAIFQGVGGSYNTYDSNVIHHVGRIPNEFFYNHDYVHDHGIRVERGDHATVINNIFYKVEAGWMVAIGDGSVGIRITNNTFFGPNPGRPGNAVLIKAVPDVNINNNIFCSMNEAATTVFKGAEISMKNNLFYPEMDITYQGSSWPGVSNKGNPIIINSLYDQDPRFRDADNHDFRLQPTSPALDAGTSQDAPALDIAGNPRPSPPTGKVDIGAYEYKDGDVNSQPQCSDGIDNDGDGFIDLDDPGCANVDDDNEYNQPTPTEDFIRSNYTSTPIVTDGILLESAWSQAGSVTFSNPSRSDNLVKVSTLWDDRNLYFAYEVTDAELEATDQQLYRDDGAEIYLDTQNNKTTSIDADDHHFMININDLSEPSGINLKTVTSTDGYTMEIAIPWSLINTIPSQGKVMGLLLGNNDRDNGSSAQFDWLDLIETGSYSRPHLWGEIVIAGETVAGCDGDLNGDGHIDVVDLQLMVNLILGSDSEATCADLNNDGVVSIVDLQVLVNRILG